MKLKKNIALSESGFVFDPSRGESFSTNAIGLSILEMVRNGQTEEEIRQALLEEYIIDQATVEKDLYDFLHVLKKHQLIET